MVMGLGAALHGKAARLVEDEEVAVLVDHHAVEEAALLACQRLDVGLGRIRRTRVEGQRRHPDLLLGLQPRAGLGPRAAHPHLARAGQLVEIGECHLRKMDLEPAVKAHPRLVGGDDMALHFGHCARARTR